MNRAAIILAAGKGTRMNSELPKVLHQVGGQPMVNHVLDAAYEAGVENIVVVTGHMAKSVERALCHKAICVFQAQQQGTGHAVLLTREHFPDPETSIVVLCGDAPLLRPETIMKLMEYHESSRADATVLTAILVNPFAYGRIVRDQAGSLVKIVEEKDADLVEKEIHEINTGTYCFRAGALFEALAKVGKTNSQGEYYLTDVLGIIRAEGGTIGVLADSDPSEVLGVNTPEQLAEVEIIYQQRKGTR